MTQTDKQPQTDNDWRAWAAEVMGWTCRPWKHVWDPFSDANARDEFEHVCRERFGLTFKMYVGNPTVFIWVEGREGESVLHEGSRESINHAKALALVKAAYAAMEKGQVKHD